MTPSPHQMEGKGRKDDAGKLRFDLIPPLALFRLAEVFTIGARHYSDRNWERGLRWGKVFGAMMRHAWKWWWGWTRDPEGQHHLASVMWGAAVLMEYEKTHRELDDRSRMGGNDEGVPSGNNSQR